LFNNFRCAHNEIIALILLQATGKWQPVELFLNRPRQDDLKFHERRDDRRVRYPASVVKSPADSSAAIFGRAASQA
jgi:hypothetical protein